MKKAVYKVPNGKLVKISLHDSLGKIEKVQITGDFFMYPEERLAELEKHLVGTLIDEKILIEKIEDFISNTKSTFFGLDAQSLSHSIIIAI